MHPPPPPSPFCLQGHDLVIVPANHTLTFEHTYTFWGHHRQLRVPAQPDVTLSADVAAHLPARCRRAHTLLLGPLMPEVSVVAVCVWCVCECMEAALRARLPFTLYPSLPPHRTWTPPAL